MSLGPVMVDIAGTELSQEDKDILAHPLVGGVILFRRNYHDPEQLANLTRQIRCVRTPYLLIAVDQEGGRVQRFVEHFIQLPSLQALGEAYHLDQATGLRLVANAAKVMAYELLACGVDFSFAPVLDIKTQQSTVIGQLQRSFDADPQVVTILAATYIEAMNQVGMQATGKHFPGHGSVAGDSHSDILQDSRLLADIENNDLISFVSLLPQLSAVMVAHVVFSIVDEQPAGFSQYWVQTYLRDKLKFDGMVFTDALDMKSASVYDKFSERVTAALAAGCDMALVCNNREATIEVLDNVSVKANPALERRIHAMRGKFDYDWEILHALPEWRMMVKNLRAMSKTDG